MTSNNGDNVKGAARPRLRNLSALAWALLPLAVLLFTLVSYQVARTETLLVGVAGDAAFVQGFNTDEADLTYRYRWSTDHSGVTFQGAGSAVPSSVRIQAQGFRPAGFGSPVTLTVTLDGVALEPVSTTLSNNLQDYIFSVPSNATFTTQPYIVGIDIPTFSPVGDTRHLGAKIAQIALVQSNSGLNLPPFGMLFWPLVLATGLAYFLYRLGGGGRLWKALGAVAGVLLALALFGLVHYLRLYTDVYLPPIAAIVGVAALLYWQAGRVASWPSWVDRLGRVLMARWVMFGAMLVYAAVSLWVLPQVDWIGHADYAENAVIARNLVQGHGLTVVYLAQFYDPHPALTHPAETWPLLQPLLIAPFFALFGTGTWIAKLPNLLVLLGLAYAVFALALRLWDSRVGLLAGILTLLHPYFFNAVLYPINDLAFAAIFFGTAWLTWHLIYSQHDLPPEDTSAEGLRRQPSTPPVEKRRRRVLQYAWLGTLAALLIWSKPSGGVLLVGLVLWVGWMWLRVYRPVGRRPNWRGLVPIICAFVLVLLPLVVRNVLAFGAPFFSTEGYDAWILRYWPFHEWEDIYKVYTSSDLPNFRWVLGGKFGYDNLLNAIGRNIGWVWQHGVMGEQGSSDFVFGILPLATALVGLVSLTRRVASLFGMVALCMAIYTLFVLGYWHFEGRYFQVAVPWLYMLLAWGLFWLWDRLRAALQSGLGRRWSLLILPVTIVAFIWPSLGTISDQINSDTQPTNFVTDMQWLSAHTALSDVVMTRDPWELNWYTDRRAVMIPNDDLATIMSTARQYGATYLQLGGPVDGISTSQCPADPAAPERDYPTGSRPQLGSLYCGKERIGFQLVYRDGGLTIYKLTP